MKESKINISFLFLFANGSDIVHLRLFHILLSFKFSFRKLSKIFSMENICLSRATNVNNVLFQEYFLENGTLHHLLKINIINTRIIQAVFLCFCLSKRSCIRIYANSIFISQATKCSILFFSYRNEILIDKNLI